jgi:NAD+ kinase
MLGTLAGLNALTPISPFRPRRRHGALLSDSACVEIVVLTPDRRPVAAVVDHDEVRGVHEVQAHIDHGIAMNWRGVTDPQGGANGND